MKSLVEKKENASSEARKKLENNVNTARNIEQGKKSKEAYEELNKAIKEAVDLLNTSESDDDYNKQTEKLEKAIEKFKSSDDLKKEEKDEEEKKEKENEKSDKKTVEAKIMAEDNKESMADIFLKDHKVITGYNKEKDETTYELTFKRYEEDKPSVSKLYVKDAEDFKEAKLVKKDKGVNTFNFTRKSKPEKEITIDRKSTR